MNRFTTLSLLGTLSLVSAANAAITSTAGSVFWHVSQPTSALAGALVAPVAHVWNEQQNVTVSGQPVNIASSFGGYTGPTPYTGSVSGTFDSHFIHFDPVVGQFSATGTVTFVDPIIAIIYDNTYLDATDATFGSFGTLYDTGNPNRSFAGALNNSSISWAGNSLTFNLWTIAPGNPICELRVLTHPVPAPGSLALLGVGGLATFRRRRSSASVA